MNTRHIIHTGYVLSAALLAGAVLFVGQVIGQCGLLDTTAGGLRPAIVQDGIDKALGSPLFMAEAVWYLLLGTLVHALLLLVPIVMVRDVARHRHCRPRQTIGWIVVATQLFFGLLFLWNSALFPFSDIVPGFRLASIWPLVLSTAGFIILFIFWLLSRPRPRTVITAVSILFFLFLPSFVPAIRATAAQPGQPNVILIGIDSLRPDHLAGVGKRDESLMPHLEHWLSRAVVYDDAITPMARTFPALTSLLTAKYPRHNGARINLTPENRIDLRWTLAEHLKARGYITAFAIDGARFVNISRNYGFDILATPQQGLADYIFGDIIDSVGTNLLNLFPVARWLNPVGYGNGAASGSYRPAQYDNVLARLISRLPTSSSFVMTHFDLAHLPYVRKDIFSRPLRSALPFKGFEPYERGLEATDRQFARYITTLKQHKLLDNAIVAVYSDHGEEFGIDKDNTFRQDNNLVPGRLGHGSSIFSPAQNHILLAMQVFKGGQPQLEAGHSRKPALLTDIAPTVLHQLERTPELPADLDGINLAGDVPNDRIRYMESSVLMPKINMGHVDRAQLLARFGNGFRITDDLRVRAKKSLIDDDLKQLGAIIGNRIVGVARTRLSQGDSLDYIPRWRSVTWPALDHQSETALAVGTQKKEIAGFFGLPLQGRRANRLAQGTIPINHFEPAVENNQTAP